jgi:ketopantoate reductase
VLPAQKQTAEAFLAACKEAKIDAELTDDIVKVLWEKFVLLVAISATTTVTRSNVGTVRADPDLRWMLEACMRETWALGRKKGVPLADDLVAQTLKFVDGRRPRGRRQARSALALRRRGAHVARGRARGSRQPHGVRGAQALRKWGQTSFT